ncbi:NUDIX domain-containing protein [Providencia rettgeri]|uniref:NUDIX domain-containing protein n=1 Tax=Providencia rettgeri TaxID=587 RepID=A0A939SJ48_PRORE|nr:NUDIX domain-containing protein [Providencia rettgeri]
MAISDRKFEPDEKPYETACREIKEETGFEVEQNQLQDLVAQYHL